MSTPLAYSAPPDPIEAGYACPQTGYWVLKQGPHIRRYFSKGQTMTKAINGSHFITTWHWDRDQEKLKEEILSREFNEEQEKQGRQISCSEKTSPGSSVKVIFKIMLWLMAAYSFIFGKSLVGFFCIFVAFVIDGDIKREFSELEKLRGLKGKFIPTKESGEDFFANYILKRDLESPSPTEAGNPSPKSGFWRCPLDPDEIYFFEEGQIMKSITGSPHYRTIWYWDKPRSDTV